MNKTIKAGILTIALVVPALLYLYLKFFGHNYYTLPVYYATDSIPSVKGYKITKAHQVPTFKLLSQDSLWVEGASYRGKIVVTDFVFTRCQGICPKMTNQLVRIQEEFATDSLVKIVSFTVDPEFDGASVLRKYSKEHNVNNSQWTFYTGSKDSIYALAQRGYFLTAMEDRDHPVDFIHSDKVVLVDKEGWIRGYYNGTDRKEIDRLIAEIKVLKRIYEDE